MNTQSYLTVEPAQLWLQEIIIGETLKNIRFSSLKSLLNFFSEVSSEFFLEKFMLDVVDQLANLGRRTIKIYGTAKFKGFLDCCLVLECFPTIYSV